MNVQQLKDRHQFLDVFTIAEARNKPLIKKELEFIKFCFVFRLYWIGQFREHAAGLLRYYEQVWPVIAPHVRTWRDAGKRYQPRKVNKNTGDILRLWLTEPDTAPPMMALLDVYNKTYDQEAADVRLDFNGLDFRNGGSIELYLPAEWIEAEPQRYADWLAQLAGCFEFCSGLAGYGLSLAEREGETMAKRHLYALSQHHPGLDVRAKFSNYLGQGIKGANWLTFLHPNFIDRLGGRDALDQALDLPGIRIVDLPSGVMIQAGPAPQIGDVNHQENCPYYHTVGGVLAPIRDRNYPQLLIDETGDGDSERTEQWLSRFDGGDAR